MVSTTDLVWQSIKIENNLDLRIDDDSNTSSKDFDDEEMLEDDEELDMESEISTIEELSESKLYLKYDQIESEEDEQKLSDSEQHLMKTKRRRKYRKSDEEKLFE